MQILIRNDNPDKGTETVMGSPIEAQEYMIRNDNPDKGTETFHSRTECFTVIKD